MKFGMWKLFHSITEVVSGSYKSGSASDSNDADVAHKGKTNEKTDKKIFIGRVTNVFHDHGLVDNEIYFPLDIISKQGGINVGDRVRVLAQRKGNFGGWRAESVEVCNEENVGYENEDWNTNVGKEDIDDELNSLARVKSDDLNDASRQYVARVLSTTNVGGSLDNGVIYNQTVCENGFIPVRGDWVNILVERGYTKSISAVRWRSFTGKITGLDSNGGYIDNEIFFLASACEGGLLPQKWTKVCGKAVESDARGRCNWRAVNVKVVAEDNKNIVTSPLPNLQLSTNELFGTKEGLEVTELIDFGNLTVGETKTLILFLRHRGNECKNLLSYTLGGSACKQFEVAGVETTATISQLHLSNISIWPGTVLKIKISCKARYPGRDWQIGLFDFGSFRLGHKVQVLVTDVIESIVGPSSSYNRKRSGYKSQVSLNRSSNIWIMPGQKPDRSYVTRPEKDQPVKVAQYFAPSELVDCINNGDDPAIWSSDITMELDISNYQWKMGVLLNLEDIQQQIDMREFDLERVCLQPVGPYLLLKVVGLSEGRPSLLVGDRVILTDPCKGGDASIEYEGYIHEVHRDEVLLKFHPDFHANYYGEDYNARFISSRTTLRRCHQAVELSRYVGSHVLFPSEVEIRTPQLQISSAMADANTSERLQPATAHEKTQLQPSTDGGRTQVGMPIAISTDSKLIPQSTVIHRPEAKEVTVCDKSISLHPVSNISYCNVRPVSLGSRGRKNVNMSTGRVTSQPTTIELKLFNDKLNERQRLAVRRILNGQARPLPYVLFGPPGTGKTVTLVEAILQVHTKLPFSRILVCAPSNSATDLLAERLHSYGNLQISDMARLNALYRQDDSMSETVQQYCCAGETLEQVAHHRIVVCTCVTAGQLHTVRLPRGHFTHVFIDEAGQATEPEILIALTLMAGGDFQIVLAGDPMQLGPVLRSQSALKYGLGCSLLERLMKLPIYQRDEQKFADFGNYDPLLITKLLQNYRSHPLLLQLPSQLFYHNELIFSAPKSLSDHFVGWPKLPAASVPLIFHGVQGEETREGNSPSWFNASEAVQVVRYLQELTSDPLYRISAADIGVVTPYKKQVEKIRLLIDKLDVDQVKVGSVEEFQGQERMCIIISTVRSSENLIASDVYHNLGFLCNPKRFNVAITRPQALLILIGNPCILNQDEHWAQLLRYCVENKSYTGCELPNGPCLTNCKLN